jgi:hypothetical protein
MFSLYHATTDFFIIESISSLILSANNLIVQEVKKKLTKFRSWSSIFYIHANDDKSGIIKPQACFKSQK